MRKILVRESIFKILFRYDFHDKTEFANQVEAFFGDEENLEITEEEKNAIEKSVNDCVAHMEEIDEVISSNSKGWTIERIGKAELAILRLAVYEIKLDATVDRALAINEAINLAKRYADEKSYSFVNGILTKVN